MPKHNKASKNTETTGTRPFIQELRGRIFKGPEGVLVKATSQDLSYLLKSTGFKNPILIKNPDGLDLLTPDIKDWTDLEQYIDADKKIEIIDVESQDYLSTSFSFVIRYIKEQCRTKLLNVLSLECSDTRMGKFIKPPSIARELDWVTKYWTTSIRARNNASSKPKVMKFCLISPIDAYTDFHIDFGGSSVWYHVVKGAKTFYLIRPTAENLELYTNWMESSTRLRTFFADQVKECYKITLYPGNTFLLPTGWIHAVLTEEDSLVFGGNFLHSLNIQGQLKIYDLENQMQTTSNFMYPEFEEINWRAAQGLMKELEEINYSSSPEKLYIYNGLKILLRYLKHWNSLPKYSVSLKKKKAHVIEELAKNLKKAEKMIIGLNQPKPERVSTRPRKKRVWEDFVDYSSSIPKKKYSVSLKKKKAHVIEELAKNLKKAEKMIIGLNQPKPERVSTRPRKKRVWEDFVDYSSSIPKKDLSKKERFRSRVSTGSPSDHSDTDDSSRVFRGFLNPLASPNLDLIRAYLRSNFEPRSPQAEASKPDHQTDFL